MANDFTPKLGRIGWKAGTRLDRYINRVMNAAHAAGHVSATSRSKFTGARMGRGSAFGTLAGAGLYSGSQRRAIVKARITKLKRGDLDAARAHLRYIQRDGVTPEGEPSQLYGPDTDEANGTVFLDSCDGDRHQFRLIVSADDGAELADLKPFIRDMMAKVETDLGTRLDWVAVDHFNTGHPHTHIIIRGRDDQGSDLVIAKDYMSHGFRMRARELVTLELGPEIESDMTIKLGREVEAERFTRLDRALLRNTNKGFLVVSAMPPEERQTHASHMGRLRKLEQLGLAKERQTGVWQITSDMESTLRSLGQRGDIIKTMHRALREAGIDRPGGSYSVFDTDKPNNRIVGRVAGIGLADEINDRHYVVIDALDGKVHYADVGHLRPEFVPEKGMIVAIDNRANSDEGRTQTRLRILTYLKLEKLIEAEGATWLDKELLNSKPDWIAQTAFGSEARAALTKRRQWLISQSLGRITDEGLFRPVPDLLNKLRNREFRHAGIVLSRELNLSHVESIVGERIDGTYVRPVNLTSGRFAVIQRAMEFVLVPWQPQFEKLKGTSVSGVVETRGIAWDWSARKRQGQGLQL